MDEFEIIDQLKSSSKDLKNAGEWITEFKRMIDAYATKLFEAEMEKENIEKKINLLLIDLGNIK